MCNWLRSERQGILWVDRAPLFVNVCRGKRASSYVAAFSTSVVVVIFLVHNKLTKVQPHACLLLPSATRPT